MKKIIAILVISILVASGLGAVALPEENNTIKTEQIDNLTLSSPIIEDKGDYISLELKEATSSLMDTGKPVLPRITKIYKLPFGSIVKDVFVEFSEETIISVSKQIQPAPRPIIDGEMASDKVIKSKEVYLSNDIYPYDSFTYKTVIGLDGTEHVVFLSVQCYPIRYSPAQNNLYFSKNVKILIEYEKPINPITFPDTYDLVIIAPLKFEDALIPLIDHKNSKGMNTTFMSTEDIYANYKDGRDNQENIKLFIKHAVEEMGVNYVLLVGGRKGQMTGWYVPVRNTNNHAGSPSEYGVDSDLYYADLYKWNNDTKEWEFEDWDSNGNNIFAEYKNSFNKDIIDGAPDVYIGRLACRSLKDVKTMVEKIIKYEEDKADESWFKDMLLIGGDTYPNQPNPENASAYEAEIDTELSASYMTGFRFQRLWTSNGNLTEQKDVVQAINNGAGFIHMAGHANPHTLVTHMPEDPASRVEILTIYNIFYPLKFNPNIKNKEKLPVILIGGCHNSQYNVTVMNFILGILQDGIKEYFKTTDPYGDFWKYEWIPKCFSWWLTIKPNGGAIATMGNTGLGMGLAGYSYTEGLDGWLFPRFFYNYGQLNKEHVGEAQGAAITDYVLEFDINDGDGGGEPGDSDRQMISQWALLGDPSLLIGGYE